MSEEELLEALATYGVAVYCQEGKVTLTGSVARVPPMLLEEIRARKQEVLHHYHSARARQTRIYPLSLAQTRLDYIDQLQPNSAAYIVAASLCLHGEFDSIALVKAWKQIEARHEALRTCVYRDGEESYAKCLDASVAYGLPATIDLRTSAPEHATLHAAQVRSAIATASFDLQQSPLWRCALLQHDENKLEVVFAIHHLIADGWSLANMLREFADFYGAAQKGKSLMLPAPSSDYASYGAWQRANLNSDRGQAQLQWWVGFINGYTTSIAFPTDRPRPTVQSDRGGRVAFSLDPMLSRRLRDYAAEWNSTLSELVSAVHAALLHLYSGTTRFLVGMAVSTRPGPAYRHVFGFFVNWLPVPADFRGKPSFEVFFERWLQARRAALAHQDTPYDSIVRAARCQLTLSSQPLCQHMMVSHVPARGVNFGDLHAEIEPLGTATAKVDLTLFLADGANALPLSGGADAFIEIEFSTALFDCPTIQRFGRDLRYLLGSLPLEPGRCIADWASGLAAQVSGGNILAGPLPRAPQSPVTMMAACARRHPDAPAIVYRASVTTYSQFWQQVMALIAMLRTHGLQPGDRVALCAGRSVEMLAAFVATMGCKAVVVPIDPALPPERLTLLLSDSTPVLLLCGSAPERAGLPSFSDSATVYLENFHWPVKGMEAAVDFDCDPELPAYLLYTSGSTGIPKGVLGTHGALGNFIAWLNAYLACGPGQRVLAKTSIGFDASMRETLAPLCAGAAVVLADEAAHSDPEILGSLIVDENVTLMHGTPTVYRAILQSHAMANIAELSGLALRHVMCGGEPLGTSLARLHHQRLPGVELHNAYGPTECTIDVLVQRVEAGLEPVPLGHPIDGVAIYLADAELNPAPPGALGEIIIGGIAVGPGYWRRPREQAERFITPERGPLAGQRVFRTGDLARMNCRRELVFAGRVDRQIKSSGARVELEEIEAALLAQPNVADAAVLAQGRQEEGACKLVAFVVLAVGTEQDDMDVELHRRLARRLPTYMRPSEILILSALPCLASGKRDWQALETLSRRLGPASTTTPSMEADERAIADLMSGLLGIPVDDQHLDFFRAGGHSLNAARLLARVRRQFGVALSLRELFADASVSGLTELVRTRRALQEHADPSPPMPDIIAPARRPRGAND